MTPNYVLVRFENGGFAIYEELPGNTPDEKQYRHVVSAVGEKDSLNALLHKTLALRDAVESDTVIAFAEIEPFLETD